MNSVESVNFRELLRSGVVVACDGPLDASQAAQIEPESTRAS